MKCSGQFLKTLFFTFSEVNMIAFISHFRLKDACSEWITGKKTSLEQIVIWADGKL